MAKQKRKSQQSQPLNRADRRAAQHNVVDIDDKRKFTRTRKQAVSIIPRNTAQEDYLAKLEDATNSLVIAVGPAGTGKTMIATLKAIKELLAGNIERIIVTRPAVSVDEEHGFLPGDLNEKMAPWVAPLMDILEEYFSPDEIETMLFDKIIEISPLAYMRGRTFKNCIVLFNDAQNTTPSQMKMALTRIGDDSRMFVTGDLNQSDYGKDGLHHFSKLLSSAGDTDGIAIAEFGQRHVVRSEIVKSILGIYGDDTI